MHRYCDIGWIEVPNRRWRKPKYLYDQAAVLATLGRYQAFSGEKPVLCLDDLFSELDLEHQAHCLRLAFEVADQVLVTGVAMSEAISAWPGPVQVWQVNGGVCFQ